MDILHIGASPKGDRSTSDKMAAAFLARYLESHPEDVVRTLNVFDAEIPAFGREEALAKFAPIFGETKTADQEAAWKRILLLIEDFDRADKVVISCPMWNMSVPWRLKQYLDCLMQPFVTFTVDASGQHVGMLRNRPVQLLLTRSSIMPGDYADFQLPYLKFVLDFMGLHDTRACVAWQTTRYTPEERAAYTTTVVADAAAGADSF